jgi:hypothetical protein
MELPQLLAGLDVKKRQDEENGGEEQHQQILHCKSPGFQPEPGRLSESLYRPEIHSGLSLI